MFKKVKPLMLDDSFRFNIQKSDIQEETARSYLSSSHNYNNLPKSPRYQPSNGSKTHRSYIS